MHTWIWFRNTLRQKIAINYLYFGSFFIVLGLFSILHCLYNVEAPIGLRLFFLCYALGQALLEVLGWMMLSSVCKRSRNGWIDRILVGISFLVLGLHFADFTLVQLMDTSIQYAFKCLFGGDIHHFIATIQSLHLNVTMACLISFSSLMIPCSGILLNFITQNRSLQKPWTPSLKQLLVLSISLTSLLCTIDLLATPYLPHSIYEQYKKTLPLGTLFVPPAPPQLLLAQCPKPFPPSETFPQCPPSLSARPNIYLWIIESLRRDFIQPQIAPHLTAFGEKYGLFSASFANANATHLSWFAIFHSLFPYHWTGVRDHGHAGSLPLQVLQQLGYKIRVYSSANLRYYDMDTLLFGKEHQLLHSLCDFSSQWNLEPYQRDHAVVEAMLQDLQDPNLQEGQVYLLFLDATHSEYSFPLHNSLPFSPIAKEINYLKISHTKQDLELIKNRYRNAVHYVDQLLGRFISLLEQSNQLHQSILVITGDHGEEFFEEGALFHATHLNTMQTSVPILGTFLMREMPHEQTACHIDIFPTILETLCGHDIDLSSFDGRSLWHQNASQPLLTVMQNGADTPVEFTLQQEQIQLRARFLHASDIYREPTVEILSLKIADQEQLHRDSLDTLIKTHCPHIFDPLLFYRTP